MEILYERIREINSNSLFNLRHVLYRYKIEQLCKNTHVLPGFDAHYAEPNFTHTICKPKDDLWIIDAIKWLSENFTEQDKWVVEVAYTVMAGASVNGIKFGFETEACFQKFNDEFLRKCGRCYTKNEQEHVIEVPITFASLGQMNRYINLEMAPWIEENVDDLWSMEFTHHDNDAAMKMKFSFADLVSATHFRLRF